MVDEYGTAIRYRIMMGARLLKSQVTANVQDEEMMQLCVDSEVEPEQDNEQGGSCFTVVPAPLTAEVATVTDAAADAATGTAAAAAAAEHLCVSTMCMDEEKRQQRRRRRTPFKVAIPEVFESKLVSSSADKNRTRNTALNRIVHCASTFENAPTPSAADVVAGNFATERSMTAAKSSLAQSTFESKPMRSTADVSLADCNHCGPLSDGIFESAPIATVATVTFAETLEATSSDKDQHIFESQPLQSFATVRHGERPTVEDTQIVFESKPVASKAHAKAGVDGVADSESEYETDEDTCEPLDSEEETTAEEV